MVNRCCGGGRCFCSVVEGYGVTVTGTGALDNPFVVTNDVTQEEIEEFLAEVLSEYPDVIAAAVALAQSDAGLVHLTDPGIFHIIEGEVILDGEVLDMAILTEDDHLLLGWRDGVMILGRISVDDITVSEGSVLGAGPLVPLDLFASLGQSNSTDRSSLVSQMFTPTPYVMKWDDSAVQFVTEEYDPPWLGSGGARGWSDRDARAAGRRSGSIPCGIGGTGFTETTQTIDGSSQTNSWDHTNGTVQVNMAERARDMILAALAAAPEGSELKGILWSQGEADRGSVDFGTEATYAAALDELIDWMRTELGMPDLPWIISPFTPLLRVLGNTAQTDLIAAALEDTPRRVEFTSFALAAAPDDSEAAGFIHWSPDAQHRRGAAMINDPDPMRPSAWDCALLNKGRTVTVNTTNGTNVVTAGAGTFLPTDVGSEIDGAGIPDGTEILIYTSDTSITMSANATATASPSVAIGAPPRTPPGLKITRSGDEATITWGHPGARVESFTLETNVAEAGWVTETLPASLTHTFVKTVTAGDALWARITANCLTGDSYASMVVKA